ncbi:MAG: cation:proton antiporter [Sporocytophaga sp.]|uniref:cation:proton antiporter n=1 Tax=Sporocytophaga sp. TaxID=2231183 RepID=UPI001B0EBED9|nr:cation:proton antiporter [Sporocytophaga sp.]MBO9700470.1 cation:proton antiporter [Sporocytophaga sp.]
MVHLPPLISDLGLILGAAGLITLIFKRIKQPLVLGYIIAGLLVGPHISLFPNITDEENIKVWAEIGVIFLLFTLGLEFSFKKLASVGGAASITAIVEVIFMVGIGFGTGKLLGWSNMDSIFLGGILSVSSTTIIIRAFEELDVKTQQFAILVFGVLIVEDLVAILLLVLLSTLAVSKIFSGAAMLVSVLKLAFFLILWFIGGIFLIPTFLKKTRKLMNDETLLIVSIALCLIMVLLATKVGFSPALGAFIMGSILAETTQGEKIEHLVKSVKDLFGAIFFVSVGMLINPEMLIKNIGPVLLITFVTIVGKLISSSTGAMLSGQSLKNSVQSGMSLAQIGEFSFIIATLGLTLKVTSDFLYPIAVAVSAITTFTTPYLIRLSPGLYSFLEKKLPSNWIKKLNKYSSTAQVITTTSDWKIYLHSYIYNIVIQSVCIISIFFVSTRYILPFVRNHVSNIIIVDFVAAGFGLLLAAPFLWALSARRIQENAFSNLWHNENVSRGPLIALNLFRVMLGLFFTVLLVIQFISDPVFLILVIVMIAVLNSLFSKKIQKMYSKIERRFLTNLNEKEVEASHKDKIRPDIVPWDAHLVELKVSPESPFVGQNLFDLGIREKFGVNVAMIERGRNTIANPGRDEKLYPGDEVMVIGTDDQLAKLKPFIELSEENRPPVQKETMTLQKVTINSNSPLKGITIRSSGMREKAKALVVGLERDGERILNPDSSMQFEEEDIVWIVGNPKRLQDFMLQL